MQSRAFLENDIRQPSSQNGPLREVPIAWVLVPERCLYAYILPALPALR